MTLRNRTRVNRHAGRLRCPLRVLQRPGKPFASAASASQPLVQVYHIVIVPPSAANLRRNILVDRVVVADTARWAENPFSALVLTERIPVEDGCEKEFSHQPQFLLPSTRTPDMADFTGPDSGKTAHYMLRRLSTRGEAGRRGCQLSAISKTVGPSGWRVGCLSDMIV